MHHPTPPLRLTRAQVREIDRRSLDQYHIPTIVLMENAARAVADVAVQMIAGVKDPGVVVVCGGGNNGGDGLAVARHLHNRGVENLTILLTTDPATYAGDALTNWRIIQAMNLSHAPATEADVVLRGRATHLLIDAVFGTGLTKPPRDPQVIEWMNARRLPVLSVDLPSGLDCDTGNPLGPACVRATRTVTFVAEKVGFSNPIARQYLGDVAVGDIGCPRALIEAVARPPNLPGATT